VFGSVTEKLNQKGSLRGGLCLHRRKREKKKGIQPTRGGAKGKKKKGSRTSKDRGALADWQATQKGKKEKQGKRMAVAMPRAAAGAEGA